MACARLPSRAVLASGLTSVRGREDIVTTDTRCLTCGYLEGSTVHFRPGGFVYDDLNYDSKGKYLPKHPFAPAPSTTTGLAAARAVPAPLAPDTGAAAAAQGWYEREGYRGAGGHTEGALQGFAAGVARERERYEAASLDVDQVNEAYGKMMFSLRSQLNDAKARIEALEVAAVEVYRADQEAQGTENVSDRYERAIRAMLSMGAALDKQVQP